MDWSWKQSAASVTTKYRTLWPKLDHTPVLRVPSLDLVRGAVVVLMVFVEQLGGDGYPALRHSRWAGITITDLVLPAFLVVLGASLACAAANATDGQLLRNGVRRAVEFVAVGLVFNAWSGAGADLSTLRYFGVLQRIGVCSLVASLIIIATRRRPLYVGAVVIALLVGYGQWLVNSGSGCGANVTPRCNAAGNLDRMVVPLQHLYLGTGFPGADPEGLASTAGAVASVLIGWLVMEALRSRPADRRAAIAGVVIATGLLAASMFPPLTAGIEPIKRIWTPAFALRSAAPIVALLALVRLVDIPRGQLLARGLTLLQPLRTLGRDALVIYVGQHIVATALNATHVDGATAAEWLADHLLGSGDRMWLYYAAVITMGWMIVASARSHLKPATAHRR